MKTRDIRTIIQKRGDEGVIQVMEALNEGQQQYARDLKELAVMFDQMINTMNNIVGVADRMKTTIEEMRPVDGEFDLVSVQSLGRDEDG